MYVSQMCRNSSADQAVRALTCLRGASLKCYCPFLHLFYGYFANVPGCVTERDCGAFLSLLKSARDRSSVWEIRYDRRGRIERRLTARKDAERRHTERVPSWLLVEGEAVASLSRPPRVFLSWCPTSADPRGRTIRGCATPTYDRSSQKSRDSKCERNASATRTSD